MTFSSDQPTPAPEAWCVAATLHSLHGDVIYLWTCLSPPSPRPQGPTPHLTHLCISRLTRGLAHSRQTLSTYLYHCKPQAIKTPDWRTSARVNRPLWPPQSFLSNPHPPCSPSSPPPPPHPGPYPLTKQRSSPWLPGSQERHGSFFPNTVYLCVLL